MTDAPQSSFTGSVDALLMRRLETAQNDCMAEGQAAAAILLQDARAEIVRLTGLHNSDAARLVRATTLINEGSDAIVKLMEIEANNPGAAFAEPTTVAADLDSGRARPNRKLDSSDRGHLTVAQAAPEWQRLNRYVKDRKDRKSFNDPVTALEWSKALQDFTVRARHVAGNLAAHNWDVTIIGDRLLLHCHWGNGKWFDKGSDQPTPMTDTEQAALHPGKPDRYGVPPQPNFGALITLLNPKKTSVADEIISQIEDRFPNWKSYRDLIDCIDCTLHAFRVGEPQPTTAAYTAKEPFPAMAALLTTLNVMKSAHNRGSDRLMSIWESDVKAVEAAVEALSIPSTDREASK